MSSLLVDAFGANIIERDDKRALGEHFRQINVELTNFGEVGDQRSPWWPGNGGLPFGASTVDFTLLQGVWYALPDTTRGSAARYGVSGITPDVFGTSPNTLIAG